LNLESALTRKVFIFFILTMEEPPSAEPAALFASIEKCCDEGVGGSNAVLFSSLVTEPGTW
jgi:hypothetical protein